MSLQDALSFGKQGLDGSFKGTNEQLRQAKQILESTLTTTVKGSDQYKEIREALAGIAIEEKRVGKVSAEVQKILSAGYGVATYYCGDVDPDYDDSFTKGAQSIYPNNLGKVITKGR